jgi:hypothetical protein
MVQLRILWNERILLFVHIRSRILIDILRVKTDLKSREHEIHSDHVQLKLIQRLQLPEVLLLFNVEVELK